MLSRREWGWVSRERNLSCALIFSLPKKMRNSRNKSKESAFMCRGGSLRGHR